MDKKLSAGLETLKKSGYPFETKIFTDLGHGGLAGEHPEAFSQEVQAAHRRFLERCQSVPEKERYRYRKDQMA